MNNRKYISFLIIIISFFSVSQPNASTTVINFNAAPIGSMLINDYVENGYKMEVISGHYDIQGLKFSNNGTNFLGLDRLSEPSKVLFTNVQGEYFNFISYENIALPSLRIQSSSGGDTSLEGLRLSTFTGSNWNNLSWLSFTSNVGIGGVGVDTITLKTVPVPTAIWLFGSGLIGLFGLSGNKKIKTLKYRMCTK